MKQPEETSFLTDKFFLAFGMVQFFGVLSFLYPYFLLVYLLLLGFLLALTIMEKRSLVPGEVFEISVTMPRSPELGQRIVLKFQIKTGEPKVLKLSKIMLITPGLKCLLFHQDRLPLSPIVSGSEILLNFDLLATASALGYEDMESVSLAVYSPFWMWYRRIHIRIGDSYFRVAPTHEKISEQAFVQLRACQRLFYQGNRRSTRGRAADQFYSIRKYQFPDPIRFIDQKKTAKFNQIMTRTYDSIYNHHLIMALDVGRAMAGRVSESARSDYYVAACLALAQNAVINKDQVTFFSFSQEVHHLIVRTKTLTPFQPVFKGCEDVQPREAESNFDLINRTLARLAGQRSIVLIFTDISRPSIQEALLENLPSVCHNHLTVVISLLDEFNSLHHRILEYKEKDHTLENYARLLYAYWINERGEIFQSRIARLGGGVITLSTKDWLGVIVKLYVLLRHSLNM